MARRGERAVDLAEPFARFASAIVIDAIAFVLWDVGTRPPSRLFADLAAGTRRGAIPVMRGLLRFVCGALLLLLAARLLAPVLHARLAFNLAETYTLFAALAVELLIGDAVRRRS